MLEILKVVRKVRVPEGYGWHLADEPQGQLPGSGIKLKNMDTNQPQLKLTIPEIKLETAWSNSPKNQRLSNMITGSNTASREDLDVDHKDQKTNVEGPTVFTEEEQWMQDPGSPCSITPFILPPSCCRSPPKSNQSSVSTMIFQVGSHKLMTIVITV